MAKTLAGCTMPCGTITRYKSGCRCVMCKAANTEKGRRLRRRRGAKPQQPLKPCGTHASYNRGCRCDLCRTAAADYHRKWHRKHGRSKWQPAKCGTISKYNGGCRCGPCRKAKAEQDANRTRSKARRALAARLVARDGGFVCQWCGVSLKGIRWGIDHIWPRAHKESYPGGIDRFEDDDNKQLLCTPCNTRKRDALPDEAEAIRAAMAI